MHDTLIDIVRHTGGINKVDIIKITGTDMETKIQAHDDDQNIFIEGALKSPERKLAGEFGVRNLQVLNKLLTFPTYRADGADLLVKYRPHDGKDVPNQFEFKDCNGTGTTFKLTNIELVPKQATSLNIPWDITITPEKSKLAEFTQLSSVFSGLDKEFSVKAVNGNLVFMLGEESSSTHNASMVFAHDVKGVMTAPLHFAIDQFLNIMKIASGYETTMMLSSKGLMGFNIETPLASYRYFLRAIKK